MAACKDGGRWAEHAAAEIPGFAKHPTVRALLSELDKPRQPDTLEPAAPAQPSSSGSLHPDKQGHVSSRPVL